MSKVIPNLLITSLEQSGYFQVMTWERLYDLLKQVGQPDVEFIGRDLGFELCQKDGVEVIVLGSVTKVGNTFVTDAKVLEVATKKLLGTASSRGDSPDSILKNQVDDLSRQIARNTGLSPKKHEATAKRIGDLTTSSLDAYNYYLKAVEESGKNRPWQARPFLEKAVELDPDFAMALSGLGGEYLKKAKALSKNVSGRERLYIEARYAWRIEGDRLKAQSIFRQIARKYPKEKNAIGWVGILSDNPQEAIEWDLKALAVDPNYGLAMTRLGYNYLGLKQPERALDIFKRYAVLRPGEANPLDSIAEAYFLSGQVEDALDYYHQAVEVDPDFSASLLSLGYVYAFKEDYPQALSWIDRYVERSAREWRTNAYLTKGFFLYWLGSRQKGLGYVRMAEDSAKAIADRERNVRFYLDYSDWLRSWIFYDSGDLDASRRFNEEAMAILSQYFETSAYHVAGSRFLDGLIALQEGNKKLAESSTAEIGQLASKIGEGLRFAYPFRVQKEIAEHEVEWLKAMTILQNGPPEKAVSAFGKAAAIHFAPILDMPDYSRLRHNTPFQQDALAKAFAEKEDMDAAIAEYERLITFDPKSPSRALIHPLYHYLLGILYEQKGLKDKAKAQYERFLDIWKDADPDRPEPADARKRLAGLT